MTRVADLLRSKGSVVHCVDACTTVLDAVRVMNERHVGSVLVTSNNQVVGILTERDLLTRVLAHERDPRSTIVEDVMTRYLIWARDDSSVDDLRSIMRERRIRHIPVRDEAGNLRGMISQGDLNAYESESLAATVTSLEEYLTRV